MTVRPNANHFLRANPRTAGAIARFIGTAGTRASPSKRRGGLRRPRPIRGQATYRVPRSYDPNKRIVEIRLIAVPEENPDLSFLGEVSDTPGPNAIDRFKAGKEDLRPRDDYRYFNPATEYTELDYKEFVDYGVTWEEYYVKAEAIVQIDGKVTRVDSSGLGGVGKNENEGNAAFNEYWDDERADLADKLKQVGFSDREIRSAPILKPGQY